GDLDNNDAAWYLHPFETIIGEGGAKIDVVGNMKVEVGEVKAANTNISITKTGSGELKLIDDFDLGTNGLIKLEAGVLAVGHGTNYNPTITNGEIIHSSPSLQMSNSSKFVLDNRDATLNQLLGSANTEVSLSSNQLKVNSGTFSGKINGLANSQIVKDGSGYLTINGNNSEMAGALVQNSGTVELQSNWGDNNHAGRIEQNNGRFIFNGGDNSSPTRVFGDAKFNGAGIVEIHSNVIAKSFEVGAGTDLVIDVTPLNRDWSDLITVDNSFNADTKIKLQEAAEAAGLLYSRTGTFDNNDTSFSIQYDTITLSDYAIKEGMTRNIGRVGSLIDDLMAKSPDFAKIIYDFDRDDVNILLTEFLGAELAANARFLAFHNPQYRVFDHLRSLDRSTPSGILGQSGFRILSLDYDLWFEGNFRSEQVKGDGDSWGYDVDRGGIFVGLDAKFGDRITSGLMFSYGNPHISNRIGKITADDISFGIYSRFKVFWECSINVFLGYGVQNYKYNNAGNTTDYNGDSLYASMEISRPLPFYAYGQLIPIFAIDFQKAWSDAFAEGNPNNFGLTIGKSDIDQAILRFGLNSKITPTRRFHLRTKLQYGLQVAGDLYASAPTSFTMNPTITQNFRSVKRGRNNLNIGIGTDIYTIDEQTKFFIDYDYIYNKKSDTHALQLGIITTR
ncbi:MAG: autotransporter domain-containing protein, partial [Planctomycetaceae bacterium]|nr:autotransporter domain-containing protein [Planctomycetaceae bacterium]